MTPPKEYVAEGRMSVYMNVDEYNFVVNTSIEPRTKSTKHEEMGAIVVALGDGDWDEDGLFISVQKRGEPKPGDPRKNTTTIRIHPKHIDKFLNAVQLVVQKRKMKP